MSQTALRHHRRKVEWLAADLLQRRAGESMLIPELSFEELLEVVEHLETVSNPGTPSPTNAGPVLPKGRSIRSVSAQVRRAERKPRLRAREAIVTRRGCQRRSLLNSEVAAAARGGMGLHRTAPQPRAFARRATTRARMPPTCTTGTSTEGTGPGIALNAAGGSAEYWTLQSVGRPSHSDTRLRTLD